MQRQSLDPRVLFVFFIKNFVGTAYILPIWFIGVFIFEKVWISTIPGLSEDIVILLLDGAGLIFLTLLLLVSYYWSWLTYTHFSYELRSDGLHIYSGALIKRHTVIAFSDIERVDLLVNPFVAHFLNLYSLKIKTRELIDSEGIFRKKQTQIIPGLTEEVARALRPELLRDTHLLKVKKTFYDPVSGNYR